MRKRGEGAVEEAARDDVEGPPCTTPGCTGLRHLVPVQAYRPDQRGCYRLTTVGFAPSHSRFCRACISRLNGAPRQLLERAWTAGPDEMTKVFDEMSRWLAAQGRR
jgi:hypothetical protein